MKCEGNCGSGGCQGGSCGCGSSGGNCPCGNRSCKGECMPKTGDIHADMMMGLGMKAWAELMKEKMKKEFEKNNGERMNKVAAAAVEMVNGHWQHKMEGEGKKMQAVDNLKKAFMS